MNGTTPRTHRLLLVSLVLLMWLNVGAQATTPYALVSSTTSATGSTRNGAFGYSLHDTLTPVGGQVFTAGAYTLRTGWIGTLESAAPALPPTVAMLAATGVTTMGAMLNATINPNGSTTTAKFQYGTSTSYGTDTAITLSPNDGTSAQNVSAVIGGLLPHTEYHFRATATNSGGTTDGADLAFTTANTAPVAPVLSPSSVAENEPAGTAVGSLGAATDADGDAVSYTLVSGTGSADNGSFTIDGATLQTAASFNFEMKSTYNIRVRAADAFGGSTEAALVVTVTNVTYPQTITFNPPATAGESETLTLSATGGASGNPVTFMVQSGPGVIASGNQLSFTGTGAVVVKASQAGGGDYSPADPVDRTISIHIVIALEDDGTWTGNQTVTIDVLFNDAASSGTLTLNSITQPPNGGVASILGGKVVFDPTGTLGAPVSFTYTAGVGSETATANITIRPVSEVAGNYVGLLSRQSGAVRGRTVVTVTAAGGASGSIWREGHRYTLSGGVVGNGKVKLSGPKVNGIHPIVNITPGPLDAFGKRTILVAMEDFIAGQRLRATAERSPYNTANPAPQAGRFTIVADRPTGGTGPQTGAAMTVLVANDGNVTFGGKVANDLAIVQKGKLLTGGRLPFLISKGLGAAFQVMSGELAFNRTVVPAVQGALHWNVPSGADARLPGGLNQDYDAFGLTYVLASTSPPQFMFNPAAPTATLSLDVPALGAGSPVLGLLTLTGAPVGGSKAISLTNPTRGITLKTGTGWFYGHLTHSALTPQRRNFHGVVLRGGGVNIGRGSILHPATTKPAAFPASINSVTTTPSGP